MNISPQNLPSPFTESSPSLLPNLLSTILPVFDIGSFRPRRQLHTIKGLQECPIPKAGGARTQCMTEYSFMLALCQSPFPPNKTFSTQPITPARSSIRTPSIVFLLISGGIEFTILRYPTFPSLLFPFSTSLDSIILLRRRQRER